MVACLRTVDAAGRVHKEVRTFGTMTADLLALAEWLTAEEHPGGDGKHGGVWAARV